ncbi:MAG: hypothetical protein M1812_005709 [Candelaria pacifica]|nr:MAG: hypothetical protein M1812_005709 [Candelaria pacifica]
MDAPRQRKLDFFDLPGELRNQVYYFTLCCVEEIHLNAQQKFKRQPSTYPGARKTLTPSILRVNRELHEEAISILWGDNKFCVTVNESSHHRNEYVVPALWWKRTRDCVYRIRELVVNVQLRREYYLVGGSEIEAVDVVDAQEHKCKFIGAVRDALEELCMTLAMSDKLKEMEIRFVDEGWTALTHGKEHECLEPLLCLRKMDRVSCIGVPTKFAEYLEHTMRQEKIMSAEWGSASV